MIEGNVQLARGITARPARPGDKNFLANLYRDKRTDLHHAAVDRDYLETVLDMQLTARTEGYGKNFPDAIDLVLEKAGTRIGHVTLDIGKVELRLIELTFIPQLHNKGYGRTVVQWIMQAAATSRRPLVVPARRDDGGLIRFLLRHGFVEEPSLSDAFRARLIWFPTSAEMNGIAAIRPRAPACGSA
ncbi:GNAT family N-acetyltransferase [Modicisalibacter coralii]|uniref:GNAT family N-acetyltransferase n=1 Tax=Modicisalibacter coralii TaxID=2304602 RepID=UPI00100A5D67|nr:GNAT family N-acetyltransferase [Halomonas coralii]